MSLYYDLGKDYTKLEIELKNEITLLKNLLEEQVLVNKAQAEQLILSGVVSSAFAKEMYSKINESTKNHKGRNAPQIFKDNVL